MKFVHSSHYCIGVPLGTLVSFRRKDIVATSKRVKNKESMFTRKNQVSVYINVRMLTVIKEKNCCSFFYLNKDAECTNEEVTLEL